MPTSVPFDEKQILLQIADGDERAFTTLFDAYWDRLYQYLLHITKSPEMAEEIAQEVFIRLWTGRVIVAGIRNIDRFLQKVAYNKAMDFFRIASRHEKMQQLIARDFQATSALGADIRILDQEAQQILEEALGQLSPQRRLIFTMHRLEGLSNDEIAQQLHLSRQTVKNTMTDAQRSVQAYLNAREDKGLLVVVIFINWFHNLNNN